MPFQSRLLPWEPARHFLKPGTIATVHSSRTQTQRALAQRAKGWAKRLPERKWLLRQASCSARNAGRSAPRLKLAEAFSSPQSPEYMHFQGSDSMQDGA